MSNITFDIKRLVPKYIYNDKNGYALSKAIERAFQYVADRVEEGLVILQDPDKMPEWRLDELAEDYNILYDYNADIEVKRNWIKNAIPYYRIYGTPEAIVQYLTGYFNEVELEEWFEYGADPFLFRLIVDGTWTPENEAWARKAIERAKNVRSVLDSLRIGSRCNIGIMAEGAVLARFAYPLTGAENWAGRWPQTNTLGIIDETGKASVDASGAAWPFPYPMTGTTPEINTLGIVGENDIEAAQADDTYAMILYKLCGQDEI